MIVNALACSYLWGKIKDNLCLNMMMAVFGLGNMGLHTNEKYQLALRPKLQPAVGKNSYN